MSRDPYEVIQPQKIEVREPDFRDNFWQQVPNMRPTVPVKRPATFRRCIFDTTNKRVYHYKGCEHDASLAVDTDNRSTSATRNPPC